MLTQKQVMWGKFISLTLLLVVFCAGIFFVFNTSRASEKNIEQNITLNNETKEGEESTLLPASSETQNSSTNEISNSLLVSGDDNADASTGDDVANAAKNDLYVYVIDVNGHLSSITLDYIYKYSSMETEKYSQDFTITNFSEYTNPFQPYTEETNPCGRTNPAWEGETIKEVRIRGVSTNENGYYISEIRTEVASFESLIIGENPALYESYNASDHNNFVPEFWVNHTDSPLVVVWISTSPKTYTLSFWCCAKYKSVWFYCPCREGFCWLVSSNDRWTNKLLYATNVAWCNWIW